MMSAKRYLLVSVASLFLVAVMALNVQPQGPAKGYHPNPNATPLPTPASAAQPDMQPMWAVNGMIRWPKDYGVIPVSASLVESMNYRCISFYVAALDPRTNQPLRGDHSQVWKADEYRDPSGRPYYVCRYALKLPANRQVRVIASMGGDGLLPSADPNPLYLTNRWILGARNAAPPAGSMPTRCVSPLPTRRRRAPTSI